MTSRERCFAAAVSDKKQNHTTSVATLSRVTGLLDLNSCPIKFVFMFLKMFTIPAVVAE